MYRFVAFIAVVAIVHWFVDAPLREAFSGTVRSSSMFLPVLNLAAPEAIFYGVAGLTMPLVLIGSRLRFATALIVGGVLVLAVQTLTMFVLGSVSVSDWRGYIVVGAPVFVPVIAFVVAAYASFALISWRRRKVAA